MNELTLLHIYSYERQLFLTALWVRILLYFTGRKYAFYSPTDLFFVTSLSASLNKIFRVDFFLNLYFLVCYWNILWTANLKQQSDTTKSFPVFIWKEEFAIQPQVHLIQYLSNTSRSATRFCETRNGNETQQRGFQAERERSELLRRRCELQIKKTRRGERS